MGMKPRLTPLAADNPLSKIYGSAEELAAARERINADAQRLGERLETESGVTVSPGVRLRRRPQNKAV